MTIAFISDLHLEPVMNDKTAGFFDFLDSAQNKYQQLYILGDFFEYWIGDDDNEPVNLSIQQKLKAATDSGLDIFFVHGNRDFLIGSEFEKNTGVKIIEDMTLIEIGNKSVMVAHGDSFCTDDVEYQEMKKEIRSDSWKNTFLAKSIDERIAFANNMRAESAKRSSNKPENIMDVNCDYVSQIISDHNIDYLIHGHTHRPKIHQAGNALRAVLGSWEEEGWVIEYNQEHLELKSFTL